MSVAAPPIIKMDTTIIIAPKKRNVHVNNNQYNSALL